MNGQIFISYRREESRWSARSLYPSEGGTPDTTIPLDLERSAEQVGHKLRIEAFPARGFAESWQPSASANVVAEIVEFAYTSAPIPWEMPSNNNGRLFIRFRSGNSPVKEQISASDVLMETGSLWQWRVWSISDAGDVSISESRSFSN